MRQRFLGWYFTLYEPQEKLAINWFAGGEVSLNINIELNSRRVTVRLY